MGGGANKGDQQGRRRSPATNLYIRLLVGRDPLAQRKSTVNCDASGLVASARHFELSRRNHFFTFFFLAFLLSVQVLIQAFIACL